MKILWFLNYLPFLGGIGPFADFSFDNNAIESATEERIIGIVIDNKQTFKFHLKNMLIKNSENQN